jgi:hypothetical protein
VARGRRHHAFPSRSGFACPVHWVSRLAPESIHRLSSPPASLLHSCQTVPDYSPVVHHLRLPASAKARLTRRGLTFRRKPQTFGEHGSHMLFATHASILTSGSSTRPYRSRFSVPRTLPYHDTLRVPSRASVHGLSPVTLSAQARLTSELLRTL